MTGKVTLTGRTGNVKRYVHTDAPELAFHAYEGTRMISVVRKGEDIDGIMAGSERQPEASHNQFVTAIEEWVEKHRSTS